MTLRRYVVGALVGLSVVAPYDVAVGQVGHDPGSSPYRDVPWHSGPVVFVGHLGGDRGEADAGVSNAQTLGLRYELSRHKTLGFQFVGAWLHGDRFIIDPSADSSSPQRKTGPYPSDLVSIETAVQLHLTGGKSWHRLAPYVGGGVGVTFDANSPGDTTRSGYTFGTKFTIDLMGGVRWYPFRRVMINADGRLLWWRLKYPVSFHNAAPDGSRVLSLFQDLQDWTLHPWVSVGLGWNF